MHAATLTCSVIICAYAEQRWPHLVAAVESVQQQSAPPLEILLVIDHNPRLLQRTREALPGVVVLENSGPRGLSGARNSGLAAARGDVIAFLDDDAVAAPGWLAGLLAGYTDPQVVGVGGAIEPLWPTNRPRWLPAEFDWVVGCTYRGMPETTTAVRNLIGCNMSFRRDVFAAVGGFRSEIGRIGTLPLGCEETELCIRIGQHWPQRVLCYQPHTCVAHQVPAARLRWSYFCRRCYAEGVSKAFVTRLVGAQRGLSSEWRYTLRVLPAGVARGLFAAVARRDVGGLLRAGAILAGLALTTAGYLSGRARHWLAAHRFPAGLLRCGAAKRGQL